MDTDHTYIGGLQRLVGEKRGPIGPEIVPCLNEYEVKHGGLKALVSDTDKLGLARIPYSQAAHTQPRIDLSHFQNIDTALRRRLNCTRFDHGNHGSSSMALPIAGNTSWIERRCVHFYDGEWCTTIYSAVVKKIRDGESEVTCRFIEA